MLRQALRSACAVAVLALCTAVTASAQTYDYRTFSRSASPSNYRA